MAGREYSIVLRLGTDTVIGNHSYVSVIDFENTTFTGTRIAGWIREDSLNKVYFIKNNTIYFCDADDTAEVLLYDFRLQVGDTIHFYNGFNIIQGVDTIISKGIPRKRWYFKYNNGACNSRNDTIVEGIGSSKGLLYPRWVEFENIFQLMCVTIDTIQIFPDSLCSCNLVSGILKANNSSLILFPNPSSTSFTIQLSSPPTTQTYFQLYDALSRPVKREEINAETTTLQRGSLPTGIYFWQLQQAGKILERGKLVME